MAKKTSVKELLFNWLTTVVFDEEELCTKGGLLRLVTGDGREDPTLRDCRSWRISPLKSGEITAEAKKLAEAIEQEAEAQCTGKGGGRKRFRANVFVNGERNAPTSRDFTVETEKDTLADDEDAIPKNSDVLSLLLSTVKEQQGMIRDMHQFAIQERRTVNDALTTMSQIVQEKSKLDLDNFLMLRANVENQIGREAEAFDRVQWGEQVRSFMQMLFQVGGPVVMQAFQRWMEEQEAESKEKAG